MLYDKSCNSFYNTTNKPIPFFFFSNILSLPHSIIIFITFCGPVKKRRHPWLNRFLLCVQLWQLGGEPTYANAYKVIYFHHKKNQILCFYIFMFAIFRCIPEKNAIIKLYCTALLVHILPECILAACGFFGAQLISEKINGDRHFCAEDKNT